ncbi:aminopeptidase N-like isoform X1 [Arapaima gigas]
MPRRACKTLATAAVMVTVLAVVIAMITVYQILINKYPSEVVPEPTVAPSELPLNMRLPRSLIPDRYRIYLQVHLNTKPSNITNQTFSFSGNSTVKFKCVEASKWIYIHCKDLNLTFMQVMDEKWSTIDVKNFTMENDERNFLEIELTDTLRVNATYYLVTAFNGPLVHSLAGLYIAQYRENQHSERYIATSHMQPTEARKVFPCFDEPAMKAVFEVTIIHRNDTIALSNTAEKDEVEIIIEDEAWLITEFFPTQNMSTYLLAFIVFDYEAKMTDYGRYVIKTWARPEAIAAGHADYAQRITGQILQFFEDIYDIKYPLPKLDQIAVSKLNGNGMENWGLIIYQEGSVLYQEGLSTTTKKETIAEIVAHELAHQWFGNLVTMKWWNDLWLNEAFATYYSYLGVDKVEPTWNYKDLIFINEIQFMLHMESMDIFFPIITEEDEVQSPTDINAQFNSITYSKGASLLKMLSNYLSESVFENGLKSYLKAYQYNNADYRDLWHHLQKAADINNRSIHVEEMMETWTKQIGYPLITIDTSTGDVSQRHFLLNHSAEENLTWHVPIRMMKAGSKEIKLDLLTVKGPVSKLMYKSRGEEWVLANVNCTGYYRVNYDLPNWKRLLQQLETNHQKIPVISRGQLIDDAFNLAHARYVNITLALDTTKFLQKETEYIPWHTAIKNLHYIRLMLEYFDAFGHMKAYLQKQVAPLYDHFEGFTIKSTVPDSLTAQYNQINAVNLACTYNVTKCQKMATDTFNEWKKDPSSKQIHPNLKSNIFCTAIAAGGEEEWDFAWEMFQNATNMIDKKKLRLALTCTKEPKLLRRYLELTLDPDKIRKDDCITTINNIARKAERMTLAWDFIKSNWEKITQIFGKDEDSIRDLIVGVSQRFCSEAELKEEDIQRPSVPIPVLVQLQQFLKDQGEDANPSVVLTLEYAIERTQTNIQWMEENKQIILDWFRIHSVAH